LEKLQNLLTRKSRIKSYTNSFILFLSIILLLSLFFNCQRRHLRQISTTPHVKKKYKKKIVTQRADFKYLSCKSKIEYTDGLTNFNANAIIRLKKDSLIWVSVSPALGVEVLRCLITKDSVFVMNKLQKEYYLFSYSDLKAKLNYELNYELIQSVLLGNPPYTEIEQDSSYSWNDTSYTVIGQSRKNIRIENFVKNSTLKLEKIQLDDITTNNSLDIIYESFTPLGGILFAFINKISLKYHNDKGFQNIYIGIEHSKVEIKDRDLKFPFKIKSRYETKE
jgi:hypothetical protein